MKEIAPMGEGRTFLRKTTNIKAKCKSMWQRGIPQWEIAEILSISKAAVSRHLGLAARPCGKRLPRPHTNYSMDNLDPRCIVGVA